MTHPKIHHDQALWPRTVPRHPLDEVDEVPGRGPATGDIPITLVGDMPTAEATPNTNVIAGTPDRFLQWGLATAGIYVRRLWITSLLTRRPSSGDINHPNAVEARRLESPAFQEEIRYVVGQRQTKVIGLLGPEAATAFGITTPITKVRGSVFLFNVSTWTEAQRQGPNTVILVPTYHPAYLVRNRWTKSGKGRADYAAIWQDDLAKIKRIADEGWHAPVERFNITPTLEDVRTYVEERRRGRAIIAVDIETTGFSPDYAEIVCIGLAHTGEDAIVIPLIEQQSRYWRTDDEQAVKDLLRQLFADCRLMFQNALFDVPFLRAKGYDIPIGQVAHDTLLLHHAISPELAHNLGFIVSQYGETPFWKDDFSNRDTTIVRMDPTVLKTYNARDCVVLHQVLPNMLADLQEVGAADVYHNESLPLIEAILEMMDTGVLFDAKRRNAVRRQLTEELATEEATLRTLGNLPTAFNLSSDDDLRLLLLGEASSKYDKGEDYRSKKVGTKIYQQLKDLYDVRHETTPFPRPGGFKGRRTKSGTKVAVNQQGRLSYRRHLQNRLSEIARLKKPSPKHDEERKGIERCLLWMDHYQTYTSLQKILSTYMDFPTKEDGRVHTKFMIHGTATGRLSSRDPNLQNIPKRKGQEIRSFFRAANDHVIVAADYANLEVKVLAYETQDPQLIEVVDAGQNMHDVNTRILFNLTPDDPQWKAARAAAKIFMFGSLAYGGGDNEIYEKVILDVPDLRLTFREFVEAKQRFMDAHPVYRQWRFRILEQAQTTRQVANAFGRVRSFYGNNRDIGKEALNFPIQSAAASIINRATIDLHKSLRQQGLRSRLQAQIHDELRLEAHQDELPMVLELTTRAMEQVFDFHGHPRRFNIEIETGPNWADLTPLEAPR